MEQVEISRAYVGLHLQATSLNFVFVLKGEMHILKKDQHVKQYKKSIEIMICTFLILQ